MYTLALSLALSVASLASQGAPATSKVLATAPAEALFLAYTPDLAQVREVMTDNPWYAYFIDGPGSVYLDWTMDVFMELEDEEREWIDRLAPLAELARAAQGELLVHATDAGVGLTIGGEHRVELGERLTAFLEGLPVQWMITQTQMHGHTVQLWSPDGESLVIGRASGPDLGRLFVGETQEKVIRALRGSIAAELAGELTPDAQRVAARVRGGVPRFVLVSDLGRLAELAAGRASGSDAEAVDSVIAALGLDQPTWLMADVHQSSDGGLHEVVKLSFGAETGLARLADNFHALELADLTGVPIDADYLGVGRIDVNGMIETALDLAGPEARQMWSAGLAAGESATGVHLQEEVLGLVTGRFAYWRERWPEGGVPFGDILQGATIRLGVLDGDALQDSLFDLLDTGGMGDVYDVEEIGGHDVWLPVPERIQSFGLDGGELPSLVFTPEALLVVSSSSDVETTIERFATARVPAVSDSGAGGAVLAALDGSFAVTRQEMVDTVQSITSQLHLLGEMIDADFGEEPTRESLRDWFPGRTTVSWKRTAAGLELVGTVR